MFITTGNSVTTDAGIAIEQAWSQLAGKTRNTLRLLLCNATANYDPDQLRVRLSSLAPQGIAIGGASSCLGVMNKRGFHSDNGYGLSLIAFSDDHGDFGVGLAEQGSDSHAAGAQAIHDAIANAGRPGELPDLIWLNAAPGREEEVISGITSVIGPNVPIIGGSSGDNTIAGDWWQFSSDRSMKEGVLVVAMYPECEVSVSFHSGYAPTDHKGVVTAAEGRILKMIDNKPAAEVYNQWTNGLIDPWMNGGNILAASTFRPLGREAGRIQDIPYFALMHPEQVLTDGSMTLFSDVAKGEAIALMEGSPESLTRRAGSVAKGIISRESWRQEQLAGALVVYCAGCMLGVRDRLDEVSLGLHEAMQGADFQTIFTFGEQGCFIDGVNRHANLMISVTIFANPVSS